MTQEVRCDLNQFPTHLLKLHSEKNYDRNSRINMPFTVMLATKGIGRTGADGYNGSLRSNQILPARLGIQGARLPKISREASIYRLLSRHSFQEMINRLTWKSLYQTGFGWLGPGLWEVMCYYIQRDSVDMIKSSRWRREICFTGSRVGAECSYW